MNISEAITNEKLIIIMEKLKKNDIYQEDFLKELVDAKFLCPVKMELQNNTTHENKSVIGKGSSLSIMSITDNQENHYLMAFTDWDRLRKWNLNFNQQTLIFSCEDYMTIMKQNNQKYQGMVINPNEENLVVTLPFVEGRKEYVLPKGERVMIGEPYDYPTDLVKRLVKDFNKSETIKRAFLLWMVRGKEASYLLVIDSNLDPDKIYPRIGEICKAFLGEKMLDIVSANSSFGKSAILNCVPFFEM